MSYLESFLYAEVILASFKIWEKILDIIDSFITFNIKGEKMSEVCGNIFVRISDVWVALVESSFLISASTSFIIVVWKESLVVQF